MNLKPAPFALTPAVVEHMLDLADSARPAEEQLRLPVYPLPHCAGQLATLTHFPKPSAMVEDQADGEPARVAPVQTAPSAPAEFPTSAGAGNGEGGERG
ncbi:hypothetical protein [Novosphingobium naphthalenivorans]|uniref:hypothetical protein n=1 Tax=Novosphingobium naphthalenivorans TaxID=273168 RepID=UPI000835FE73|nr:hypothetical protein [Novosphingobium naphthalenivorans]